MRSSWTRDWTCAPSTARQFFSHWTTRKALGFCFILVLVSLIQKSLISKSKRTEKNISVKQRCKKREVSIRIRQNRLKGYPGSVPGQEVKNLSSGPLIAISPRSKLDVSATAKAGSKFHLTRLSLQLAHSLTQQASTLTGTTQVMWSVGQPDWCGVCVKFKMWEISN